VSDPPAGSTTGPLDEGPVWPAPRKRRRVLLKLFLLFCVFSLIAFGLLGWYVTTDSFQQRVRRYVIASAEKLTGGRVELGELHTIPFRLRVDARNLVIHGREAPDQTPFLSVDRVQAELKIVSLLSTTVGLHTLALEHPVAHIIVSADGTTNVPAPKAGLSSAQGQVQDLISLAVSHCEVQRGEVQWEDKKIPVDFDAHDLTLLMDYSLLKRQYNAHVVAGSVTTRLQDYPAFVWRADASLVLFHEHADITDLTLTSGKSEIHFAGRLQDFLNPTITASYHGFADIGELASIARQAQLRKGVAQLEGKLTWSQKEFSTQGTLQAKDLEWSYGKLSMKNGRLASAFAVTPDRFRLSSIRANLLGGDLSGEAEVTNWQSALERKVERRKPERAAELASAEARRNIMGKIPPRGSVRLQLAGFPILPGLEWLSSPKLPLDQLALSGNASGNLDLSWVGSIRDAETRMKLAVSPPKNPIAGGVPVQGQIDGTYHGSRDELSLSSLHATTPGSEITASGELAQTSSLRFSLSSHNLRELTPLIDAAYGSPNLPFAVHGWASLTGNASGKLSALAINGNLEVYDFDAILPTVKPGTRQAVHWDALTAAVQYSSNHFAARNGSLFRGHATGHFDVSAGLTDGEFLGNDPFALHLDFHSAQITELAQVAGVAQPLAGTLGGTMDASITVSGTGGNPHGDGHIEIHNGVAYGVGVPSLTTDLRLNAGELELNNIEGRVYGAMLSGSAAIATSNSDLSKNEFRLNLSGSNLSVARLPRLRSDRVSTEGMIDFTVKASGTGEVPSIEAHVHGKDLTVDQERIGNFYIDAVTHGRRLDLTSRSEFDKADLSVAGTVALEHDFLADLKLDFHHLDAAWLLNTYWPGKITAQSPVDGTLQVRGPLRTPRELKASAELQAFSVEVDRVPVQSVGPVRLEIADQVLLVENLHLTGSGTDFTAHGRAQLAGAQELDLRLDGSVNMTLFQLLNPKILARGTVGVNLSASGTIRQPVLQGRLEVKNTFISHNDFPSGLSDMNGVLQFDRNRIQIESLKGTTGGGSVALTGSATYENGIFVLDFGATAQGVRLRYPPGVSSTANADLRLSGNSNVAVLSGNVTVTKLAVTPGFDFAAYIEKSRQSVVLTQNDSLQSRLKLDVHVVTTPELQMQTAVARLSGDADLRLRGTAERPIILGKAEVLEGEISLNGNKYKLERGDVIFANPAKTQPIIDLRATTRVRDYDITVQFRGDASSPSGPKVSWQSEPQLPEADVIALLALGRTQEQAAVAASTGGSSFGFGGDASNLLINQALNSTVNSRLQKLFGASHVKVDPQGLSSETAVVRGPQVTVEQQVASNVTLTYSTNVSVSNQQIIQVEYNITRSISIVALRDQNGVVSFDFKIRRRKK
jgi:translocation and assembly module TamB